MSKLLNRSYSYKNKLFLKFCSIQRINKRNLNDSSHSSYSSESSQSSQSLINDLLNYAKENIIQPQARDLSFRPRYKTLTVNINNMDNMDNMDNDDLISSTENFLTPSDFLMAKFLPVHTAQNAIDYFHDYMPYWSAIIIVPFLAKFFFTIPITILSQRSQEKISPLIPTAMKEYRKAANKYRGDKIKFNKMTDKIIAKYGFNPLYAQFRPLFAALIQAPVHLTFYIAFRTMYSSYPDWKYGGLYWFKNLSVSDPYWILPLIVGASMGISFWNTMRYQKSSSMMLGGGAIPPNMIKYGFIAMSLIFIPMAHIWSAGFNIYMSANILSYMLQIILLQNDNFRNIFGLKPASIQFQYQKELRDINKTANQSMKSSMNEDYNYVQIQDKYQRKRLYANTNKQK